MADIQIGDWIEWEYPTGWSRGTLAFGRVDNMNRDCYGIYIPHTLCLGLADPNALWWQPKAFYARRLSDAEIMEKVLEQ